MVGVQIAVLRRGAGMTQAELARHIHVSASAIGMYEQGRRLPAAPILIALSRVFDVTIDYLVTGEPCLPTFIRYSECVKHSLRSDGMEDFMDWFSSEYSKMYIN